MIRALSVLLLMQVGVATYLYWPQDQGTDGSTPLIASLETAAVERIAITDAEGTEAALTRSDDGWIINGSLPADPIKIDTLLASLLTSDPGLAIATSERAAERFRVAEEIFERRIILAAGMDEGTVYLGSSPSFRKIHARRENSPEVFVVELNTYDAPTDMNAWIDRSLLQLEGLSAVELYGARFALRDATWIRPDGEAVDAAAMEQLVEALATLQVSGLVEDDDEDARAAGETLRLTATSGDEEVRLTVLDNPGVERYYLVSDRYQPTFNISAFDAERLINAAKAAMGDNGTVQNSFEPADRPET